VAIPGTRDLEVARKSLTEWFRARWPDASLGPIEAPGATGFSNETLLFDATWTEDGRPQAKGLVVRVEPTSYRVFLEADFANQYRVIDALAGRVKVAPVLGFEADLGVLGAPFFVMERVEGRAPGDAPSYNQEGFLVDLEPAQREQLWLNAIDQFAAIHRVDWRELGFGFLDKPGRGATGFDQQMRYWEESFTWAAEGRPQPVAEAAWEWMSSHLPATRPTELSWGDARIGNMLFHDLECRAVLDWEMVSLGGRQMDLGWWLFLDRFHADGYGVPRLAGLGSREDTITEWRSRTGLAPDDLQFYEVFAGFRFAVVMIRIARMAAGYGMPVPDDMESNNGVTQVLAGILGVAPPGR
jgi:aminoglycoside phosphotransferase (APT) family kinase protein